MKEYTMVAVDIASGQSSVVQGYPGFNPRSKLAFQTLTRSDPGDPYKQWHPTSVTPMGKQMKGKVGLIKMSINPTVLVLLEREVPPL